MSFFKATWTADQCYVSIFNFADGRTVFVSWMAGPSAMGSEKGTPISMMSAPPACIPSKIGTVSFLVGYPAVTKVTNAGTP